MCVKKGFVPVLFALWISFFLFSMQAWALESDGFEYNIKDNQVTITKYLGKKGKDVDVIVPSTLSGYPVTAISAKGAYGVFDGMTLRSITLPDTVVEIGDLAFFRAWISKITMSSNVQVIGRKAFAMSDFTSIDLPDTLISIGESAFSDSKITSVKIPNSVTSIGKNAFYSSNITSCQMYANIQKIPDGMFVFCKSLQTVELNDGLQAIGSDAFSGCNELKEIKIPSSVSKIGSDAFSGCLSMKTINIPYGVEVISSGMFSNCRELTEIHIPSSVTEIKSYAFWGCKSLVSLNIPNSVVEVGDIISKCDNLKSVRIPSSVVKGSLFNGSGCPKMIVYVKEGSYAEQKAKTKSGLSVVVDNSVDQAVNSSQETPVVNSGEPVWKQDAVGWWLENPDGSYLMNTWYQSSSNGLWYYLGADGYMLTNTKTPDGYWVNSDGAMVQ